MAEKLGRVDFHVYSRVTHYESSKYFVSKILAYSFDGNGRFTFEKNVTNSFFSYADTLPATMKSSLIFHITVDRVVGSGTTVEKEYKNLTAKGVEAKYLQITNKLNKIASDFSKAVSKEKDLTQKIKVLQSQLQGLQYDAVSVVQAL